MQRHNTPPGAYNKRSFSVGIRWLGGRSLHTTRCIALMFLGNVFNISSRLYDFVASLTACKLSFTRVLWHVDQ
jgi:hypothetical protein